MEEKPVQQNNPSMPVTPPGPSALADRPQRPTPPTPLPTNPKEQAAHPFPIPAGNRPAEPERKHFWKSKWFLLAILLLFLLIPVSIFAASKIISKPTEIPAPSPTIRPTPTPTPDPTANWNIYSGDGYSIKYLPTWTVDITTSPGYVNINSNDKFPKAPNDPEATTYWVTIHKVANSNNLDFKELATADLPVNLKGSFRYTTEIINGLTAYRTTDLPSMSGCEWAFFKNPNGNDYVSTSFCLYDKDKPFEKQDQYYSIFNQMLSTFKFTESSADLPSQDSTQSAN